MPGSALARIDASPGAAPRTGLARLGGLTDYWLVVPRSPMAAGGPARPGEGATAPWAEGSGSPGPPGERVGASR